MKIRIHNLAICFCSVLSIGCDGNDGSTESIIYYPSEGLSTLQEAINILPSEGTIKIDQGVFKEIFTIQDKIIHIEGSMKKSVIDGQGKSCVTILNASGSTVSGIAIVNCDDGITTDSTILVSNNYFFNNVDGIDYEGGGGLLVYNIFHMNKDDAIDLDGDTAVEISNNVISTSYDDGIEVRLHSYSGTELKIFINDNIFKSNNSNGIQLIDYEIDTNRSFDISGNTFIESGYSEISFSDHKNTLPSFLVGEISESVNISSNSFYPLIFSFTGFGNNTVFENNFIYSSSGDGNMNTPSDFPVDNNTYIQVN